MPLDKFQPLVPHKRMMPDNAKPYLLLITTSSEDAGLEVSELAIESIGL